jgi:hypothetical protein
VLSSVSDSDRNLGTLTLVLRSASESVSKAVVSGYLGWLSLALCLAL